VPKRKKTPKRTRDPKPSIGRPKKQINWSEVDKLCEIQATAEEIAVWFKCSPDTLSRACRAEKGKGFAEYLAEKRGRGKVSLRRKQFNLALRGNVTMLIWLGKQWLDQSDKREVSGGIAFRDMEQVRKKRWQQAGKAIATGAALAGESDEP